MSIKDIRDTVKSLRDDLNEHDFRLMTPDDGMYLAERMMDLTHIVERVLERTEEKWDGRIG